MTDIRKALEAAVKANTRHRITGVYPTTGEEAVRDILLAFLKAMPPYRDHNGMELVWEPADLAAAIEKDADA